MTKEKTAVSSSKNKDTGVLVVLPPDFRFQEDSHQYFLGEKEIPGFSFLLKEFGLVDTKFYTEFSRVKGKAIHKAIELDNEGDLNESTLDHKIAPYLKAWRKYKDANYVEPISGLVERPVVSSIYRFGCTADVPAYIGKDRTPGIIELKSSSSLPWWVRLQLAAQQIALSEIAGMSFPLRIALRLGQDGHYSVKQDFGLKDREDFLALVRSYWLKKETK